MDYSNIKLQNIEIPPEAEQQAKRGCSWQKEAVKGILLKVQYAKGGIPAYCVNMGDPAEGLKYFVLISHTEKALAPLKKELKKLGKASWMEYIINEIDQNPAIAASETIFAFDWDGYTLFIWTSDKTEFPVLLEACSGAIAKIAPDPSKKFDTAASKAIADVKGLSAFTKLILENSEAMERYESLCTHADALIGKYPPEKLLPFLAALGGVGGFSHSLKELVVKHRLDDWLQNHPESREKLFFLLQEYAANAFVDGKCGLADKKYIADTIRRLAGAFDSLGYGVYPKGVETVIRLFENDAVEGIFIETYQTAEDYHADDYGYYDSIENEAYYDELWAGMDIPEIYGEIKKINN